MRLFSIWYASKLNRAVCDYPPLIFPYSVRETDLPYDKAIENYEYFLKIRQDRLAIMKAWFLLHFSIDLDLTASGYKSLSNWIDVYGKFCIDPFSKFDVAWDTYNPSWADQYKSLNLIYDVAIFYGEYLCKTYPFLHWSFFNEAPILPGIRRESYYRPTLSGFLGPWTNDPLYIVFRLFKSLSSPRSLFMKHEKRSFMRRLELAAYGAEHYSPESQSQQ